MTLADKMKKYAPPNRTTQKDSFGNAPKGAEATLDSV
jgi:hypothetical protein